MILPVSRLPLLLSQLHSDSLLSPTPLLILLPPTVDSLAALSLLVAALAPHDVPHSVKYVTSLPSLRSALQSLPPPPSSAPHVSSVVLLNCGLSTPLLPLLPPSTPASVTKLYVLDSRRPASLANVHAGGANHADPRPALAGALGNVVAVVLGEGWDKDTGADEDWEGISDGEGVEGGESGESSDEESSGSEGGEESGEEEDAIDYRGDGSEGEEEADLGDVEGDGELREGSKRRRLEELRAGGEDAENADPNPEPQGENPQEENPQGENPQGDEAPGPSDAAAAADAAPPASRLDELDEAPFDPAAYLADRKQRIAGYYAAGTAYSLPTSFVLYQLLLKTRLRDDPRHLWAAVVGCTAEMLGGSISDRQYGDLVEALEKEATRLKPRRETYMSEGTVVATSRAGEVIPQDEWRL
ncbi:hypothetical protein TeGR_g6314 [Tetraparma gracilis]|uniref:Uncharacterized protein n=1 Tax=Tetraparma gracilis TaxID=2962635 RepID=A0ABQ6MSN7_9STRA|nr:hypothetical protein TeGR_g6314 [Tetraparma gracilis]